MGTYVAFGLILIIMFLALAFNKALDNIDNKDKKNDKEL